jgi:hypothetical protein
MAWEEQTGNGGGTEEEREFVSTKIGTRFEGTFVQMSQRKPSRYGGEVRYVSADLTDGRQILFAASKILLDRVEDADLEPGDGIRLSVEEAESKAGNKYALPRLYVNRAGGAARPAPAAAQQKAPAEDPWASTPPPSEPPEDDDPGF